MARVTIGTRIAFQRGLAESRKRRRGYRGLSPQERLRKVQIEERQKAARQEVLRREQERAEQRAAEQRAAEQRAAEPEVKIRTIGPERLTPTTSMTVVSTGPTGPSRLQRTISTIQRFRGQTLTGTVGGIAREEGVTVEKAAGFVATAGAESGVPSAVGVGPLGVRPRPVVKYQRDVTFAALPKTKAELAVAGASAGAGAAVGGGLRLGGAAVAAVAPKLFPAVGTAVGAGLVAATGPFVAKTTEEVTGVRPTPVAAPVSLSIGQPLGISGFRLDRVSQPTGEESATALGTAIRDAGAFTGGFALGSRAAGGLVGLGRFAILRATEGTRLLPKRAVEGDPTVPRGTTPAQLKTQFETPVLPGETPGIARGFRAGDLSLGDVIQPGKPRPGELIGAFTAPRGILGFLRIGRGEGGGLSLQGFPGGLPNLARLTFKATETAPTGVEFIPGLRPTRPIGQRPRINLPEFARQQAGTGRTFIPGAKAEPEAVTIFGAGLKKTATRFGFFEKGEFVPIPEVVVTGAGRAAGAALRPGSAARLFGPGATATTTPITSLGLGLISRPSPVETTRLTTTQPSFITAPTVTKPTTPITTTPPTTPPRPTTPGRGTDFTTTTPPPTTTILTPPTTPPTTTTITTPPFTPTRTTFVGGGGALALGFPGERRGRRKARQPLYRIPSFAAAKLNLFAPTPLKGEFTGLVERPRLKKKRKKKRK